MKRWIAWVPCVVAMGILVAGLMHRGAPESRDERREGPRRLPEERTFASGTTHIVRMGAWAVAPLFAGLLMNVHVAAPILAGAGLKIVYDVLLYRAFRKLKPPEEIKAA